MRQRYWLCALGIAVVISGVSLFSSSSTFPARELDLEPKPVQQGKHFVYLVANHEFARVEADDARLYSEGLAAAKIGGHWGYIDNTGKWAIKPTFDEANRFSEGIAFVRIGKLYGAINRTGKMIIDAKYAGCLSFGEGVAPVENDGIWSFVDREGKLAIDARFSSVGTFSEGFAAAQRQDGKAWGFIDHQGTWTIPEKFDGPGTFQDGIARVHINGKKIEIDVLGNPVQ